MGYEEREEEHRIMCAQKFESEERPYIRIQESRRGRIVEKNEFNRVHGFITS